jgi:hypothetical protein
VTISWQAFTSTAVKAAARHPATVSSLIFIRFVCFSSLIYFLRVQLGRPNVLTKGNLFAYTILVVRQKVETKPLEKLSVLFGIIRNSLDNHF